MEVANFTFNKTFFQQYDQLGYYLVNSEPIIKQNENYLANNRSLLTNLTMTTHDYATIIDSKKIEKQTDAEYLAYIEQNGKSFKNLWGFQMFSYMGIKPGSWSWFYDPRVAVEQIEVLETEIEKQKQNLNQTNFEINKTEVNINNLNNFIIEKQQLREQLNHNKELVMEYEAGMDSKALIISKEIQDYENLARVFFVGDKLNLDPLSDINKIASFTSLNQAYKDYAKLYKDLTHIDYALMYAEFKENGALETEYTWARKYTDKFSCMQNGFVWGLDIWGDVSYNLKPSLSSSVERRKVIELRSAKCIVYTWDSYIHFTDNRLKKAIGSIRHISTNILNGLSNLMLDWETTTKANMISFYEKIKNEHELQIVVGEYDYDDLKKIASTNFHFKTKIPKEILITLNELQNGQMSSEYYKLKENLRVEFKQRSFQKIIRVYNSARDHIEREYKRVSGLIKEKAEELLKRKELLFEIRRKIELSK